MSSKIVSHADDAYEAVRAINHITITTPHPGPVVYRVLGALKLLGPGMEQALGQLGSGLGRSLDLYDVYEDDGADPVQRVAQAIDLLTEARQHAAAMGALLERAQGSISRQGYRDDDAEEGDDLPRFADVRADAYALLGDVQDVLASDRRPGERLTDNQAEALRNARAAIATAKQALNLAAHQGEDDDDPADPLACMRCRVGAPLPHHRGDPACQEHQGA